MDPQSVANCACVRHYLGNDVTVKSSMDAAQGVAKEVDTPHGCRQYQARNQSQCLFLFPTLIISLPHSSAPIIYERGSRAEWYWDINYVLDILRHRGSFYAIRRKQISVLSFSGYSSSSVAACQLAWQTRQLCF